MIAGLQMEFALAGLRGADYNPRRIDDAAIARLCDSLRVVGCAKPIIARGQTIVAGHQRTRALRSMGVERAPVYLLPADANVYDEVRFNQLHNGTDLDLGDEDARADPAALAAPGFNVVPAAALSCNLRCSGAPVRSEIMALILKYGPWGACVAGADGRIFHAGQYAVACKILSKPCLVYVVPPEREAAAREFLGASYGVFSYDGLKRETYVQTFAQMMRLRDGPSGKNNLSPTYERHVIPWLRQHPEARVLDFGCGQGDYVRKLAAKAYRIQGMEMFRRAPGRDAIDVGAVCAMVDALAASLRLLGRFDAVVCDYVLNSVDSQQAEDDVLNCIGAFCRPGGRLFFSGRRLERVASQLRYTSKSAAKQNRYVEFLDDQGLSALYRKGRWFFQKFHSEDDVRRICDARGWKILALENDSDVAWQCVAEPSRLPSRDAVLESLDREFNMQVAASGRRLGRHQQMREALPCD